MQWDLVESSLGDSSKGSGSSLGARREITGRRSNDLPQEYRRLPDWRKLGLSLSLCEWQVYGRRPNFWAVEPPVPRNMGTFGD
ncbi:hypothetical protein BHE74_00040703 [Ensete ventricosum]|nr:hypothetical protein BHE74_00040703 [Ensete ventricosum]